MEVETRYIQASNHTARGTEDRCGAPPPLVSVNRAQASQLNHLLWLTQGQEDAGVTGRGSGQGYAGFHINECLNLHPMPCVVLYRCAKCVCKAPIPSQQGQQLPSQMAGLDAGQHRESAPRKMLAPWSLLVTALSTQQFSLLRTEMLWFN